VAAITKNIMAISPEIDLLKRLNNMFKDDSVNVLWEPDPKKIIGHCRIETFDVLLLMSSVVAAHTAEMANVLETISRKCSITKTIILIDPDDLDIITSSFDPGVYQFTRLPVSDKELKLLVLSSLKRTSRVGINLLLEKKHGGDIFHNIVGRSKTMEEVFRKIRQAASTAIPVILQGETGTGKDLVAQAIHRESARSEDPFIPVNLGAIPSELIGSELFGHEKGAFTGAIKKRSGCFERANSGTIFLDEIGTIDEKLQISLLRLIEQKKFRRLGGRTNISVDFRLITATNEDLFEQVKRGLFREDLYFRLDVFRISLPPLRERHGDVGILANTFFEQYNNQFKKNIVGFRPECIRLMEMYDWPGNVRELRNAVQRSVLVCDGKYIEPEHLPLRFTHYLKKKDITFEIGTPISRVEREMIVHTLNSVSNNRKKAATLLGISRRSLYNKLKKYNIE